MNARLQEYAAIAQVIGAIAIVASLVFVGLEIRANTDATYATTYDQLLAQQVEWRIDIASQPELLEALEIARSGGEVTQAARFAQEAVFKTYERAYIAWIYERLRDEEWQTFAVDLCSLPPMIDRMQMPREIFTPRFWHHIHQLDC